MGFFLDTLEAFSERFIERRARGFGRGCARVMLIAFSAMKEEYKHMAPTYAWIGRQALRTRPYWRQTGEEAFVFERTGEPFVISDDMSLRDVVHMVIDAEMPLAIMRVPAWRQADLLRFAHAEADHMLRG